MPRYLIEREIPGAGRMTPEELRAASARSNAVLRELPDIQWVQSYVTDDKITCIYLASSEKIIREHASRSGFPATRIFEVRSIFDPVTAEG